MGLIHEAKKHGLWPERDRPTKTLKKLGGIPINSAEGVRFYDSSLPYPGRDPSAILVPTAEFINPYAGLFDEDKERIMEQVEPPTMPVASVESTKEQDKT